jgi:hypothetical protein
MKLLSCGRLNTSFEHESPKDFVTSQWQTREKSVIYLAYRWTIACFFVFSLFTSLFNSVAKSEIHVYFIYLTHWNLLFTTVSMILSAILVTRHHKNRLNCDKMTRELKTYWLISSSTSMYAFLVSLIYWTLLFKQDEAVLDMNNVLVHATNSLVLIFDLSVVKHPGRFGILVYPLCAGVIFLIFSWIYPFLGGLNR